MWDEYWNSHPDMKVWVTLSQIREVYHTSIEAHRHVLGRLPAVESDSLKDFEKVWSESYTPPPLLEILGIEMSPAEVATSTFEIITTGICVSKPHAAQRVIALKRKQEFAGLMTSKTSEYGCLAAIKGLRVRSCFGRDSKYHRQILSVMQKRTRIPIEQVVGITLASYLDDPLLLTEAALRGTTPPMEDSPS